jgi:hypothetical protein
MPAPQNLHQARALSARRPRDRVVKPMDDIFQLMQDWAFDPDAMQAVLLAFAMACREMNATETSSVIKSMIARRIIGHAQRGERSADRLCRRTIEELLPKRKAD